MKRKPNYKLIIGAPLAIIVISILTIVGLKLFLPDSNKPAVTPSSAEIITNYQTAGVVGELDALYTKSKNSFVGMNFVSYTAANSYAINLAATDVVQFEQKDKSTKINSATVKTNSEAFLVKQGLQKMTSAVETNLFQVFDSDKTVCQLFDMPPFSQNGALLGLTCIDKTAVNTQYTLINKLLALYSGDRADIANPSAIQTRTIKENNKTLTVTDLYGIGSAKSSLTLFFASIDDSWEYIGQLPLGTGTTETNTSVISRVITGDLKTKINDSKYDGFLLENVQ